jgi:hypothetical protein
MRRFTHGGLDWEAEGTGMEHGVGSGFPPPITSWGVTFRCLSDSGRPVVFGHSRHRDLSEASDDDLRHSLDSAIATTPR